MNQCVPSWDLEDINSNLDVFKLDYEVAELTWENGQVAKHELGHRRVPSKSQPETSWDKPCAGETLEAIVTQATHKPYCKTHVEVNGNELVPSAIMTSDALVPSARDPGCSTRVGSCSGDTSALFLDGRVACGGGDGGCTTVSCHDMTMSGCGTYETFDTYDGDTGGQRLIETSMGSPENTSSGGDCLKSSSPDDSACHCRTKEVNVVREKLESSTSTKRRRTAANHNQSERKRRDKINQRMKTLQKMVPNSNKTDKASMLDEVIEYVKQMQAQVQMVNRMNMPPMMMPLVMQQQQQQQQMQMSMMNSMGLGMGMGMGMGFGGMDMNAMALSHLPTGFHPTPFMPMPWNNHITDRVVNNPMAGDPMSAFRVSRSQPMNMDAYSRMAALYQHMQNQPSASHPKN